MTPRQAYNIIVWAVLLPLTIAVWAQVLLLSGKPVPPAQSVQAAPTIEKFDVHRYTVCAIAGAENCWVAEAR
jgi:hypothetical protein